MWPSMKPGRISRSRIAVTARPAWRGATAAWSPKSTIRPSSTTRSPSAWKRAASSSRPTCFQGSSTKSKNVPLRPNVGMADRSGTLLLLADLAARFEQLVGLVRQHATQHELVGVDLLAGVGDGLGADADVGHVLTHERRVRAVHHAWNARPHHGAHAHRAGLPCRTW